MCPIQRLEKVPEMCCSTGGRVPWLLLKLGSDGAHEGKQGAARLCVNPICWHSGYRHGNCWLGQGRGIPAPSLCCFASLSLCLSSLIHLFLIIC